MAVRYSYLSQQFEDCPELWDELKKFVKTGDFTLGKPLYEFEDNFASLIGTKVAQEMIKTEMIVIIHILDGYRVVCFIFFMVDLCLSK
jgi:hypothetical protein